VRAQASRNGAAMAEQTPRTNPNSPKTLDPKAHVASREEQGDQWRLARPAPIVGNLDRPSPAKDDHRPRKKNWAATIQETKTLTRPGSDLIN